MRMVYELTQWLISLATPPLVMLCGGARRGSQERLFSLRSLSRFASRRVTVEKRIRSSRRKKSVKKIPADWLRKGIVSHTPIVRAGFVRRGAYGA